MPLAGVLGNNRVTFATLQLVTYQLHFHGADWLNFTERGSAMRIFSWRLTLVVIAATALISYPKAARAMTVDVTIGPNFELVFSPSSVTIHPGDQVKWTWASSGHSTTSGSPGQPNGIWDSGLHNQGATFTHTFNSAGTFPYYCIPHGGCCMMVGTVMVVNASPTSHADAHSLHPDLQLHPLPPPPQNRSLQPIRRLKWLRFRPLLTAQ